jgi:type IV pilus assembly protein PilP
MLPHHSHSTPGLLAAMPAAALGVALAALLTACSSGDPTADLRQYVEAVKARQRPAVPPLPEIRPYRTFLYTADEQGLRDPFRSAIETPTATIAGRPKEGPHPDEDRRKEALEAYPLDSLRMLGTLYREGDVWGIVQAPDGAIHRVQVANYMGQNHGQIVTISEDRIELSELVPDGLGGWQRREAALTASE